MGNLHAQEIYLHGIPSDICDLVFRCGFEKALAETGIIIFFFHMVIHQELFVGHSKSILPSHAWMAFSIRVPSTLELSGTCNKCLKH
jgi:hypothetical protein